MASTSMASSVLQSIPGPAPMPILGWHGNMIALFRDPMQYLGRLRHQYGEIAALVRGGNGNVFFPAGDCPARATVFAFGPRYNHQIMSDVETFHTGPVIGPIYSTWKRSPRHAVIKRLGTGLFAVNGSEHRHERGLLMPAFHRQRIEAYRDDMVATTEQVLGEWQPGQRRDIAADMMRLTMLVAGRTLFGVDFARDANSVGDTIQRWLRDLLTATFIPIDLPGLPYRRFLERSEQLDRLIRAVIAQKRIEAGAGPENAGRDVLSMLLHARDEHGTALTEDDLVGHATILFIAGHETSSNTLTWTLFLLAQHPEILGALVEELEGTLHGTAPTVEQLAELPLLDHVIKESMRLLSPVPFSGRVVARPTELGGYELPVGTEVGFSHYHTHRDPALYDQPQRFRPARWESIRPSPYEYMPFSAGKRMCIGAAFATMEIKIVLAILLQRYRLQLPPRARVDYFVGATLTPRRGLPMIIHPQDRRFAQDIGRVTGTVRRLVDLP